MNKKEIRKAYREKRDAITATEQMKWDDLILIQMQTLQLQDISLVLSFYPIEEYKEINSFILTEYLHFRNPGLQICYPRTDKETNTMQAIICHPDTVFETNSWNIAEPAEGEIADPSSLDAVIIPMIAFDEEGTRVGYGKGFYDRYLKGVRPDCLKIGVCYFEALEAVEDRDEFDVPLDLCITPQRIYVF